MKLIYILSALLIFSTLFSCTEKTKDVSNLMAIGGKKYGGEFRFMSSEKIKSLASISAADHFSSRMITQIYEPLLKLDFNSMETVPSVAQSFEVNKDATVYTFTLRKGILFHKNDCFGGSRHELDAEDVKFSLDMACSGLDLNNVGYLLVNKIKGAKEHKEKTKESLVSGGVSGIKIIDDITLEITLSRPSSGFEKILAHSSLGIFPKEAYDKYKNEIGLHPVGTGPFQLESMNDDQIILSRNNDYWKKDEFGNQLPFLGKVVMSYVQDKKSEYLAFRNAEIDLVNEIPVESVEYILGSLVEAQNGKNVKHKVESEASLNTRYIGLANTSDEFKNVAVRKAFNLAINRTVLVEKALEGDGIASLNGFVPEMLNYSISQVEGYEYNVAKAQQLMASAGFKDGQGFPALDFYVNVAEGSKDHKLCELIVAQLKVNLNVNLSLRVCTIGERQVAVENGKAKIWLAGWIADYPDPENFLSIFSGENMDANNVSINGFKFNNPEFNILFSQALKEPNTEKRMKTWVKCDQILIDQAAVMPLYTDDNTAMVNARIRNFKVNEMETLDLTRVFIKELRKN
ncbi:MAG: ABC transporter substrate-binding protein [Flavobacteriales bacterium]|nr:ABC transporter substrate-binding protein [Flavobacteriales bacterium]